MIIDFLTGFVALIIFSYFFYTFPFLYFNRNESETEAEKKFAAPGVFIWKLGIFGLLVWGFGSITISIGKAVLKCL